MSKNLLTGKIVPDWTRALAIYSLVILLTYSALALDPSKTLAQYNCQNWTRQGGLPANSVSGITQTPDGYIWMGTQQGLIRFDANEFKQIPLPNTPQLPGQMVASVTTGNEGGLWCGILGGQYTYYDGQNFKQMPRYAWSDRHMSVLSIRQTSDNSLWVGINGGVARISNARTNADTFYPQLHQCSAIYEDSHHRVWLGTMGNGLFYWQDGVVISVPDDTLKGNIIYCIAEDFQGRIWIGTQIGPRCYDTNLTPVPITLPSNEVRALLVDRHGTLWLGSSGGGLIRLEHGEFSSLQKAKGLVSDFVTSLYEDKEGSIWVGSREGVSELTDVKLPIFSSAEGFMSESAHGVGASRHGGLWVAGDKGTAYFDEKTVTNFSTEAGLSLPWTKRVFEARNGDVYLVTGTSHLDVLRNGRVVATYANEDATNGNNMIVGMAEDDQSVIVSAGAGLFRVAAKGLVPFAYQGNSTPPMWWIYNLVTSRDGALWAATGNGVFRIKDGVFQQWNMDNGLSSGAVLWVIEDPEGVMWAGLQSGIARIKNGQARMINRNNGLYDNYVYAIVPDDTGHLWVNSGKGIFSVSCDEMNAVAEGTSRQLESTPYDGLEAIKTTDVTSVESSGCKTSDGRVWFPCPEGVVMIDPKNLARNLVPPPVRLERIRINGRDIGSDKLPPLPPGTRDLEFGYTALSFIAPQQIQFRYRLAGYDASWVPAGTRRSAFYTNLKPGKYHFRVQACNADGVWNREGAQIEVELRPYYFQTGWFKWLCGLMALASIFGATAWRVKQVQNRGKNLQAANDLLESKVSERTGELAVANLALQGEIEAHKQVQARLQDEIAERVKADRALADQRNLLRTLIDNLPDNVFVKDRESRVVLGNLAHARFLGARTPEEAVGKSDLDRLPRELANKFYADEQKLMTSGEIYNGEEKVLDPATHQIRWLRTTKVPLRDGEGRVIGLAGINRDVTERKESEAKLEALHLELVETSRQAGKAEVAVGVLHNVGNVLNSVNVSTTIIDEKIRNSSAGKIANVAGLLRKHQGNLPSYFAGGKGAHLTAYLETLSEHVLTDQSELLKEVAALRQNVEHIKEIVVMQQSYARISGVVERIQFSELVEDALRIHSLAYQRHAIKVHREFAKVPIMTLDRHKVLQILINLFSNAKHACDAKPASDRKVTVRLLMPGANRVRIEVEDSGAGIPAANIERIFNFGFTTRKGGHGFGLHSGALAATEMGGSLTVASPGLGLGATFTLELPLEVEHSQRQGPTAGRAAPKSEGGLAVAGARSSLS